VLAVLCCPLVVSLAGADAAVTTGPSYVQVPGSPFSVGTALGSGAINPSGSIFAAADYVGGGVDALSLSSSTGSLSAAGGSPFASGHGTDAVAFAPGGNLLAAANLVDNTVSIFSVSSTGTMTLVGPPTPTGSSPRAVAFSPSGNLLAVANADGDAVSIFTVTSSGLLTPAPGSPFATGTDPVGLAFGAGGNLLAVANEDDGTVSIFTVDTSTGKLTPSAGSPLPAGDGPAAVAFNPSGTLFAVANSLSGTVSIFTVGSAAQNFINVPGSPFAAGDDPLSVAFDGTGALLATADFLDGTVALFTVGPNGSLALAQGSPFASGAGPRSVGFVPNSKLLAVTNGTDGTVSVLQPMPPPTVTIAVPAAGHSYILGRRVGTSFSCSDSGAGPGIASCKDGSGHRAPNGLLGTQHLGRHTYTVQALSADGLTSAATVSYTVAPIPPSMVRRPELSGAPSAGHVLRCSRGTWSRHPTSYRYQWQRSGVPLGGADRSSYRVARLDEGSRLNCSVTAGNGSKAVARSTSVRVPLVAGRRCPAPSGTLSGIALGPLRLGDTKAEAKAALPGARLHASGGTESFCLDPADITIGFPDRALNRLLRITPLAGHIVWALTANPLYRYRGIGPGLTLSAAEHRLGTGTVKQRGATVFYLARTPSSTIVIVARNQVVQRIGIADNRATASPDLRAALIGSLPS
jgi:6-phosphogluconolactonase (cycloisomerase 2 family)